jgi:RES domain-containing protein
MLVYRLCRTVYAKDLSGTGAALYGGRWNPKGLPLVYTAGSISLAYLEYLVHNIHLLTKNEICLTILNIQNPSIKEIQVNHLEADWRAQNYTPLSNQRSGKDFIASGEHHVLKVPSALVPNEFNYLLNPTHTNHRLMTIEDQISPFTLDERFFNK